MQEKKHLKFYFFENKIILKLLYDNKIIKITSVDIFNAEFFRKNVTPTHCDLVISKETKDQNNIYLVDIPLEEFYQFTENLDQYIQKMIKTNIQFEK